MELYGICGAILPSLLPRLECLIAVLRIFGAIDHRRDVGGTLDTESPKLLEHSAGVRELPLFVDREGAVVILQEVWLE